MREKNNHKKKGSKYILRAEAMPNSDLDDLIDNI